MATKEEIKGKAPSQPKRPWTEELQVDFDRILSVGEECIAPAELKELLIARGRDSGAPKFVLYDGFEPSGRMHIAQGVFKAMNVNKCTYPGTNASFVFWVADWFALMNDKMGGDLTKIRIVGKYLIEVWRAAGMDLSNVVFKWASEEITEQADKYWPQMLDVARRFNITRVKKCCQIMGRLEGSLTAAQILYPLMQCTDVFFLNASICQLGVDQRKVNMLAREYCDAAGIKFKPIILSHHMLFGLKAGQEKMSKSDPDSAIFMEDAAEDVERKISNAYCPSKAEDSRTSPPEKADEPNDEGLQSMHLVEDTLKNPCLDYIEHIVFSSPGATFTAGFATFRDFASVKDAFLAAEISEVELKKGLTDSLNALLEPVRNHFNTDPAAQELLTQVREFKKEVSDPSSDVKVRRLNLVESGKAPADAHLVFAGMPNVNPSLQEATNVILQLREANGRPCVLFLSDWTGRVCNACDGDDRDIRMYFVILLSSLRSLDAKLMDSVTVMYQSDAILSNPSDYWISVINVGRHFKLNDVMGDDLVDADGAGVVVARLMRVADVLGVSPKSVSLLKAPASKVESSLIQRFYAEKLPQNMVAPSVSLLELKSIRLHPDKGDAHKTENDQYFLLDDPKVHGKSKLKKAFCEPGNTSFCPPIALASTFAFDIGSSGSVTVKRSKENGGDIVFKSQDELVASFGGGSLHPGDLKAAATPIVVDILDKISDGFKADEDAAKAVKSLKASQKKLAKRKK